jgi:hypothetical protein
MLGEEEMDAEREPNYSYRHVPRTLISQTSLFRCCHTAIQLGTTYNSQRYKPNRLFVVEAG